MGQLDGKQLKKSSVSLNKLMPTGIATFSTGQMYFEPTSSLKSEITPTQGFDVVNKNYVDAVASGLDTKIPVKVVSATGPVILNGVNFQIDGYTVSAFDRVLVAAQDGPNIATNSNGIYIATSSNWYRAEDSDGTPLNEVSHGNFVFVTDGSMYEHSGWVLTITDAVNVEEILVGTESQGWVQFSEQTNIIAGDGLYYNGQSINIGHGNGITASANSISVVLTNLGGLTFSSSGIAPSVDGTTINVNAQGQLTVVSGSSQPVYDRFTASTTSGNNSLVSGVTLSYSPNNYSRVQIFVNGQLQRLGNGLDTLDCYFGLPAKNLNNLSSGDQLYWNGDIAGFNLSVTDVIDIIYES